MIERVIDNWLANVSERGYQIPFCQLLASKGYKVVYVSTHGQMEQGKDVVAIDRGGTILGYQLKAGKIDLTQWRKIRPELEELVKIPAKLPGVSTKKKRRAFLVTTGHLTDSARLGIVSFNDEYTKLGWPELETIVGGDLQVEFVHLHGRFLPAEPADFRRFLEFFLADGRGMLKKGAFSRFLISILPFEGSSSSKRASQAIASAVVLAGYALSGYETSHNYIALIDGWTLVAAHILGVVEKLSLPEALWRSSFELCLHAIEESFYGLKEEAVSREHLVEGDLTCEFSGTVRARTTLVSGYLAASDLYFALKHGEKCLDERITTFIDSHLSTMLLPGESAFPLFFCIIKHFEFQAAVSKAEGLLIGLLEAILAMNTVGAKLGLPNPYYDVEAALSISTGLEIPATQDFFNHPESGGSSYILQSVVELVASRLFRQRLALNWRKISHIQYSEFVPSPIWTSYLWKAEKGELRNRFPEKVQSWKILLERARDSEANRIPKLLRQTPAFLLLFFLVYPHRLRLSVVKTLDRALNSTY